MSVRNFATGIWNGIKKGPTHHTDGYFAAAGTTVGSAVLGGIFGGAEGAMMATAATSAASASLVGVNAMYNLSWKKGTKDLTRIAGNAATDVENTIGALPARTLAIGSDPIGVRDTVEKVGARIGLHAGSFLNDTMDVLTNDVAKPAISSIKKIASGDINIGHRGVIGTSLAGIGTAAATSFGATFGASGGNTTLAAISSATFAAGSFLAPHVNKALDERAAIRQAISRYGPKKLLVEGGIEGAKAAGEYVIGGNRKAIGRLQKIKDSFSS